MDNFPTKRHYALMAFLWVPGVIRNFLDPTLSWIAFGVSVVAGLVLAYVAIYVLTALLRKTIGLGQRIIQ
jgi:hypothetical protein